MNSLLLMILLMAGYVIAYFTYGRFLARKIFRVNPDADGPSVTMRDDVDYVPTDHSILFGPHFTSIAGLGPIVGPARAAIRGGATGRSWAMPPTPRRASSGGPTTPASAASRWTSRPTTAAHPSWNW